MSSIRYHTSFCHYKPANPDVFGGRTCRALSPSFHPATIYAYLVFAPASFSALKSVDGRWNITHWESPPGRTLGNKMIAYSSGIDASRLPIRNHIPFEVRDSASVFRYGFRFCWSVQSKNEVPNRHLTHRHHLDHCKCSAHLAPGMPSTHQKYHMHPVVTRCNLVDDFSLLMSSGL